MFPVHVYEDRNLSKNFRVSSPRNTILRACDASIQEMGAGGLLEASMDYREKQKIK